MRTPGVRSSRMETTHHTHQRHPSEGYFNQPSRSSLFEVVSGRSHSETCAGCIISGTTATSYVTREGCWTAAPLADKSA
jgi:hypothetical protein